MLSIIIRFFLLTAVLIGASFVFGDWRVLYGMIPAFGLTAFLSFVEMENQVMSFDEDWPIASQEKPTN